MSTTSENLQIKRILPRHVEIMNRLILGQRQVEIARDLEMTESRLSIIVNSPLFQLELKKKQLRRAEQLLDLEDSILKGANLGAKFHKDILEDDKNIYPLEIKSRSATILTQIGSKLIRSANSSSEGLESGDGKSYEERLREVTITERVRTIKDDGNGGGLDKEEIDETDLLYGDLDEPEQEFPTPLNQILSHQTAEEKVA